MPRGQLKRTSPLPTAVEIPALDHLHGGLAPGCKRSILGAALAVRADLPPVDPRKPRSVVKGAEDGLVAPGLVLGRRFAILVVFPGLAVRRSGSRKPGFGEDHGLAILLVDGFHLLEPRPGREVVWQRV